MASKKRNTTKLFEQALAKGGGQEKYILNLYVAGTTPQSVRAIKNIKRLCAEHLHGAFELNIIDIYQQPFFAREGQILAAPTLVKTLPLPLKRFIGDMSNHERILVGLDVRRAKK